MHQVTQRSWKETELWSIKLFEKELKRKEWRSFIVADKESFHYCCLLKKVTAKDRHTSPEVRENQTNIYFLERRVMLVGRRLLGLSSLLSTP